MEIYEYKLGRGSLHLLGFFLLHEGIVGHAESLGFALVLLLLHASVVHRVVTDLEAVLVWPELQQEVDEEAGDTDTEGEAPLRSRETVGGHLEHTVSELGNDDLATDDDNPDDQEDWVS